jgi:hypothetical protein
MSALPSNLAFVGEDLARAIQRDAQRSLRRRRAATLVVVIAVLVVTATASVANGWLFGETPTLRAVPALGRAQGPDVFAAPGALSAAEAVVASQAKHRAANPGNGSTPPLGAATDGRPRTLLADLGPEHRVLAAVGTTSGAVCLTLSGFSIQCVPAFKDDQEISWFVGTSSSGARLLFGLVRDDVIAVEGRFADGTSTQARLGNNAFYLEVPGDVTGSLVVLRSDGSSEVVADLPCPLTYPNCTK